MNRSLIEKDVVPFALSLGALALATVLADALLHALGLVWVGRYLGIVGTVLILAAFLYSARKRRWIRSGAPVRWLRLHEVLTWTGALLVLVHAGVHFNAVLPWLAVVAMSVNVVSGLVGRLLLERSRRHLEGRVTALRASGLPTEAVEREMFWDAVAYDAMKRWRSVHLPITIAFAVLALTHIASVLLMWRGR